jgi:GT2 family glycosyltransferase
MAAGVGGRIINSPSGNWVATYLDASGLYRHRVRHGTVDYLITPNVAFRRAAFEAVGGFREGPWAEDADLSFRLRAAGHTLLLANDGIVVHYGLPTSVKALAQKLYRYGYGSYAHSHQWASERAPLRELMRHAGAVVLSPLLALRLTQRLGIRKALSSWPLVIVEHSAFCYGLCAGWLNASADRRSGNGNPKLLGRRA